MLPPNCRSVVCTLLAALASVCFLIGPGLFAQEVTYVNPRDVDVQGYWTETSESLRVFPKVLELDLNQDGLPDVGFEHQLTPRQRRVDFDATRMLETALQGIEDSIDLVAGMRRFAIDAANQGVNDQDELAHAQARLDNALDTMHRIATTPFQGQGLLDGSRGYDLDATSAGIIPISATVESEIGTHGVNVTTAGERATITAGTEQAVSLASHETLVINGVAIEFFPNMTQVQVIDRINEYQSQTGVFADKQFRGATRLSTARFGANTELRVISNRAASHDSTGFGTTENTDNGVSAVVEVGGNAYSAQGDILTITDRPLKGISFQIATRSAPAMTGVGDLGTVTVTDRSPSFTVDAETGDSISVAFPNLKPQALGHLNSYSNQFANFDQIQIHSAHRANDALEIIDHVYDDLVSHRNRISDLVLLNAHPYGEAYLDGLEGAEFATAPFGLLRSGAEIGSHLEFQDDRVKIQSSKLIPQLEQSGFVGVRLPSPDGWLYGWIGVELQEDSSFMVTDYAWNTTPDEPLITGVTANTVDVWPIPGDSNFDGLVNFEDFLTLSAGFGQPGTWSEGNFNDDAIVDFTDFLILSANFQSSSTAVASVPEPLGHGSLLCVVAVLAWRRGRGAFPIRSGTREECR